MDDPFDRLLVENNEDDIANDENKEPSDSAATKRLVKPARRTVNKRPTLDFMRLTGPRGISVIEKTANKLLLKGKGHEEEDLAKIISFLYYWTHRLYPKLTYEDCLEKIEILGKKRPTQTYLTKIRLGMIEDATDVSSLDVSDSPSAMDTHEPPERLVLTKEQKEKILKNRMMAQSRRNSKIQAVNKQIDNFQDSSLNESI